MSPPKDFKPLPKPKAAFTEEAKEIITRTIGGAEDFPRTLLREVISGSELNSLEIGENLVDF